MALFLAEGFVRVFYPHSRDHVIPGGLFEIDGYLGWKLKARKSVTHHSRYFDVAYSINALGYRDRPRNPLKDGHTYRMLLYGDSQIFGWGIPEGQRFSNLVEDQKQSLEVWNLAVPGYGLDQQILSYERDGESLNADKVIFFVSKHTLERTLYDHIYNKPKPKFATDQSGTLRMVPIPQGAQAWTSILYRVLSPLYLPYFVERQLAVLKGILKEPSNSQGQETDTGGVAIGELETGMVDRASAVALKRKHQMMLLAFLPEMARKDLQNFCDQKGIGFLVIALHDESHDLIIGKHDPHWNSQAHQLIAGQLLSQLEAKIDQ
jgi:hypothetical protein